jgi:hypothetical protein
MLSSGHRFAYESALAEATIGLLRTEAIREDSPFRIGPLKRIDDVEWVILVCVDWFNASRLRTALGDALPDDFEASYHAGAQHPIPAGDGPA